jgi:hypothetical protein
MSLWSFQGARAFDAPTEKSRPVGRSLKTQQRVIVIRYRLQPGFGDQYIEVDVVLGESDTGRLLQLAIDGSGASGVRAPDSLERR